MAIYRIFLNISRTFYFSGCSVSYFSFFSVSSLSRRRRSGTAADEQCYVETQLILLVPPPQQARTRFLHQHNLTIMQIILKILLFGCISPKIQTLTYLSNPFQFKTTVQPSLTVLPSYHQIDLFLLSVLLVII